MDTDKSLQSIISKRLDIHEELGDQNNFIPRYNQRLFKLLIKTPFVIFLDSQMRIMDITQPQCTEGIYEKIYNSKDNAISNSIYDFCKTEDQKSIIKKCIEKLDLNESAKISLTASRGRGKSASLGLIASHAIEKKMGYILVSALFLENIQTLFEYLIFGLEIKGYKKTIDFKVHFTFHGKRRYISKIEIFKDLKQVVEYISPFDKIQLYPNLLIIDEAASIPIKILKEFLNVGLVLMASTEGGYEGTGHAFRIKLIDHIKSKKYNYVELELNDPIRYSRNDEIESWLNKSLILESTDQKIKEHLLPDQ